MKQLLTLFTALLFFSATNLFAQELKTPQPSPTEYVKQNFGISAIELSYSRPGMKGRQIFGDLVPYGKVWRTGANGATTLTFGDDVTIGGKLIPAGKYGLLTIPDANSWTIIITKQTDVTNPAAYKEDQDVVRLTATPQSLPFSVETFTILFGDITSNSCVLEIIWDDVIVSFDISTDIDSKVMAQIDKMMSSDAKEKPYFQAGLYYLDNDKDTQKAVEWLTKAGEQMPDAFYVFYQKARAYAKLGNKAEALKASQTSVELAKKANNADYVALNEKLQKSL